MSSSSANMEFFYHLKFSHMNFFKRTLLSKVVDSSPLALFVAKIIIECSSIGRRRRRICIGWDVDWHVLSHFDECSCWHGCNWKKSQDLLLISNGQRGNAKPIFASISTGFFLSHFKCSLVRCTFAVNFWHIFSLFFMWTFFSS